MQRRSKLTVLATFGIVLAARVALAHTIDLPVPADLAVRRLQSSLPGCAGDRILEVRRKPEGDGWELAFRLGPPGKTRITEVRIDITPGGAEDATAKIVVMSIQGGLMFDSENALPDDSRQWAETVSRIVADPEPKPWCP